MGLLTYALAGGVGGFAKGAESALETGMKYKMMQELEEAKALREENRAELQRQWKKEDSMSGLVDQSGVELTRGEIATRGGADGLESKSSYEAKGKLSAVPVAQNLDTGEYYFAGSDVPGGANVRNLSREAADEAAAKLDKMKAEAEYHRSGGRKGASSDLAERRFQYQIDRDEARVAADAKKELGRAKARINKLQADAASAFGEKKDALYSEMNDIAIDNDLPDRWEKKKTVISPAKDRFLLPDKEEVSKEEWVKTSVKREAAQAPAAVIGEGADAQALLNELRAAKKAAKTDEERETIQSGIDAVVRQGGAGRSAGQESGPNIDAVRKAMTGGRGGVEQKPKVEMAPSLSGARPTEKSKGGLPPQIQQQNIPVRGEDTAANAAIASEEKMAAMVRARQTVDRIQNRINMYGAGSIGPQDMNAFLNAKRIIGEA